MKAGRAVAGVSAGLWGAVALAHFEGSLVGAAAGSTGLVLFLLLWGVSF